MRKTMMTMGLGLALLTGGAGIAAAQTAETPRNGGEARAGQQRGPGGERGMRGQRGAGMDAMLFRGIELTADQKSRLQALRAEQAGNTRQAKGERGARAERGPRGQAQGDQARQPRAERPAPTAEQRQAMEQRRAEMETRREQHLAQVRAILTPAQRTVFDRNVAERKQTRDR